MTEKNIKKEQEAYLKVANKYPDVSNKRVLEMLTREMLMRNKLLKAAGFFLVGVLAIAVLFVLNAFNKTDVTGFVSSILFICLGVFPLIGVFIFAKAMHAPLTRAEAKEREDRDLVEKGGRTDIDLSVYDNSEYYKFLEKEFNEASGRKKAAIIIKRMAPFTKFFVLFVFIIGAIYLITGIINVSTYEERNKNAVTVRANIIYTEEQYDSNDNLEYVYTYEYKYGDKTYTMSETSSEQRTGSKDILIDSQKPEKVIVNDGKTKILIGAIMLFASVFVFIYSALKIKKHGSFSALGALWLIFAMCIIGFVVWAVSCFIKKEILSGILLLTIGCPIMTLGMIFMKKTFDR